MGLLLEAVQRGSKRDVLEALRDVIAQTIESTTSGRDVAALTKRLMEVCEEIDALPDPNGEVNEVDAMAAFIAEYDEYEDDRIDGDAGGG